MKIIIQHNSMVPIYEQLVNQIKSLILEESLKENEPLPSVRVLAKEIKASALTVKKAYDLLEQEGFITTIHGKGSFVLAVNRHAKRENLLYSTQEELEQVRQALMQLSDAQRMLFQLKFEEERPYSEIAAAFGISEALARKRVELLRKKLHALLPQRRVH